ncbi:MAG: DUF1489 family protein [Novosphingobium sp.]
MPLHLTKVAFGAQTLEDMRGWFRNRGDDLKLTTRYLPKRHEELIGGSLFWILKHLLVARSPILRFEEAEGGKTHIVLANRLIDVHPLPRRAHQGWRYLEDANAPRDVGADVAEGDVMPGELVSELAKLGLV